MHPIRSYINQFADFSAAEWEEIESYWTRQVYPKNTLLLREGEICKKLYFLEAGTLRYFTWQDGIEVAKFFTLPPYCFTSQRSFTNNLPAQESIATLEKSIVWEMDKKPAFELLDSMLNWSTFVRKLIQEVQFNTEQILTAIQNKTAEERYVAMIQEQDILLQKVPLKHLASFLGIAPQSLSRIRKKYADSNRDLSRLTKENKQ